jgi:hypothetical protein
MSLRAAAGSVARRLAAALASRNVTSKAETWRVTNTLIRAAMRQEAAVRSVLDNTGFPY